MPGHRHLRHRLPAARLAAALVLGAAPLAVPAVEPDADVAPAAALVRGLGSGALAARDEAERRLLALGPAALPVIATARATATGEAAFRLHGIQRQLEREAAARAIEASVVSLDWQAVPVKQCLEEVFSRTGNVLPLDDAVAGGSAGALPVTGRFERATFWEAVDGLLERAGLDLSTTPETPGLRIVAAPSASSRGREPFVASGPFRIAVARVEQVGGTSGQSGLARGARIMLRVAWEPRLAPLVVRLPARTILAEGPAGESMPPAQRAAILESTIAPRRAWVEVPVQLARPETPLEALGMLRGTLSVWLAGMEQTFEFSPGKTADTVRIADAEVELLEVASRAEGLLVRIRATYGAPSEALASHLTWLTDRRVAAAVVGGQALEQIAQRVEARSDRGLTVAASFAWATEVAAPPRGGRETEPRGPLPAVTISWRLPSAIHEVPVDFAVRDIPLPKTEPR